VALPEVWHGVSLVALQEVWRGVSLVVQQKVKKQKLIMKHHKDCHSLKLSPLSPPNKQD
jgi:hypothetical protein